MNRVLEQLGAQGSVRLRYGHIEILDESGLTGTAFTTADDAHPRGA